VALTTGKSVPDPQSTFRDPNFSRAASPAPREQFCASKIQTGPRLGLETAPCWSSTPAGSCTSLREVRVPGTHALQPAVTCTGICARALPRRVLVQWQDNLKENAGMTPHEAQAPDLRVGEDVHEPTQYEAGGRLRPRPWPVGPRESYGKVDFDDDSGKAVLTLYIQRGPEDGFVLHVEHLAAPLRVDGTLLRLSPAPHVDRDSVDFRRITAARTAAARAEADLEAAVRAARANGDSWDVIGAALGTSARTARERFGHKLRRPRVGL